MSAGTDAKRTSTVEVRDTFRAEAGSYHWKLDELGLRKIRDGIYRGKLSSARRIRRIERFCRKKGLRIRILNVYGRRGGSYRRVYFEHHRPDFLGMYYCVYCGKLLPRRRVTVDHLYPVRGASSSLAVQKKLRKKLGGINDPENLVASCLRCNQEKGSSTDPFWLKRGERGRNKYYWMERHFYRWAAFLLAAAAAAGAGYWFFLR